MVDSLVITLREGIEAALVVGIILAYLNKSGRTVLKRQVYLGLGAAVVASVGLAVLLETLGLSESDAMEGVLMAAAGVMVASLVVWMWRTAKHIKTGMEAKLHAIVSMEELRAQSWGLLAFTFIMVFREGTEMVLFLFGATLGNFSLLSFVGGAIGVSLAVLFAVFFIRGSLRIDFPRFFTVTSIVLLILALKLLLGSIHEFAELGYIPMTKGVMAIIGFFVRGNSGDIIVMALLAAPIIVILWDARGAAAVAPVAGESSPARRKQRAARKWESTWRLGLVAAAAFVFLVMGFALARGPGYVELKPVSVTAVDGKIAIPLDSLVAGKLAKYVYSSNGAGIRFLAVRLADSSISAALDICQICGAVGYGQKDANALCKNCSAPILMGTLGQGGGCNPLPLAFDIRGGNIFLSAAELMKAESKFK